MRNPRDEEWVVVAQEHGNDGTGRHHFPILWTKWDFTALVARP